MFDIKNCDCFEYLESLNNNSINLFLLDLPYGQTDCKWDIKIDLDKMWKLIKKKMVNNAVIIFFGTTKFGKDLINSNPKWFCYDLIWEKQQNIVGFLSDNIKRLKKHEMIYIFKNFGDDKYIEFNKELRTYAKTNHEYLYNNNNIENQDIYNLIKCVAYSYLAYNQHPQKTKCKLFKRSKASNMEIYAFFRTKNDNITGDGHPTSIIKDGYDKVSYHRTAKPVELLEWLIKTYTNDNMSVCDFINHSF